MDRNGVYELNNIRGTYGCSCVQFFMNGFDRFDLLRARMLIVRRERCVPTSIFTFCLDAATIHTYALRRIIRSKESALTSLCEFKLQIAGALVAPLLDALRSGSFSSGLPIHQKMFPTTPTTSSPANTNTSIQRTAWSNNRGHVAGSTHQGSRCPTEPHLCLQKSSALDSSVICKTSVVFRAGVAGLV